MSGLERDVDTKPENTPIGIIVQLPNDLDGLYENIRNENIRNRDLGHDTSIPIIISEAQINDSLFGSVSTQITPINIPHKSDNYVYVADTNIKIGTHTEYSHGFKLGTNLKPPASGVCFFSDDEVVSIANTLKEKYPSPRCVTCEHLENNETFIVIGPVDIGSNNKIKRRGYVAIYFGYPNRETLQNKLKEKVDKMEYLSLRERHLKLQEIIKQHTDIQLSIFTISESPSRSVFLDLGWYAEFLMGSTWEVGARHTSKKQLNFTATFIRTL